jgi:hypothetical protein
MYMQTSSCSSTAMQLQHHITDSYAVHAWVGHRLLAMASSLHALGCSRCSVWHWDVWHFALTFVICCCCHLQLCLQVGRVISVLSSQ